MNVISWNCRGYSSNYEDIRLILHDSDAKVMLLQETMLGQSKPRAPNGYTLYTGGIMNDRRPGHGLGMLIKNDTAHAPLTVQSTLQVMAFRIRLNRMYTICNIYISPGEDVTLQDFDQLLHQLPEPIILSGDLNAKHILWGNNTNDQRGIMIETLLLQASMSVLNSAKPTHLNVATGATSAIDLTIVSSAIATELSWDVCEDLHGSDHWPVIIQEINVSTDEREPRYIHKKADWNMFKDLTDLVDRQTDKMLDELSIDELITKFNEIIIQAADLSIPKTSGIQKPKTVPWWNDGCALARSERKNALRRYQRTRSVADRISYNRARARAKHIMHQARVSSWRKYVDSLNINTPMSKIWARVKKIKGKHQHLKSPCLAVNGNTVTEPAEVAEILASHYENVSSRRNRTPQFQRYAQQIESQILNFSTNNEAVYNIRLTMMEMKQCLSLCKDSAPGSDNIRYIMIARSHESCQQFLLNIYNKIWQSNTFPDVWRNAIVLSFPKQLKDPTMPNNYRPISLTSNVCKLMEKVVNMRLVQYLESNNHFPQRQYGFRKMTSTTDALVKLVSDIKEYINSNEQAICVSFDLQKAYDTAWRRGLLQCLYDCGIQGHMGNYVKNFLERRTFQVKIGAHLSVPHPLEDGVPQGSVLSCTLFSVAINDILKTVPQNIESILYVDDLLIYAGGAYFPSLERRIQTCINKLNGWAIKRGFTFSPNKSQAIHFHKGRNLRAPPTLSLSGHPIPAKECIKYLGMHIDRRLTFREHLSYLKMECMRRLDLLKTLASTSWGSDRTIMLRLYRTIIRSKLDYGSVAYMTAREVDLKMIDPVHHSAIRLSTGAFRSSPVVSLYTDSGELPLRLRRSQLLLQFYFRTLNNPNSLTIAYVPDINAGEPEQMEEPGHNSTIREIIEFHIRKCGIISRVVQQYTISTNPTWNISEEVFCEGFNCPPKKETPDNVLRMLFLEHVDDLHPGAVRIYTDGSKKGDTVGCAVSSVIGSTQRKLHPVCSIFTAELEAINEALNIIESSGLISFVIFTDSKSVTQVLKQYYTTHPLVYKIIQRIIQIYNRGKIIKICWCPSHVGVHGNEAADRAANAVATSNGQSYGSTPYFRDYFILIRIAICNLWAAEWRNIGQNKLRKIRETTEIWPSSIMYSRKFSVQLTRLRIGHTLLTHRYLMERTAAPYCDECLVPLTVQHFIAECPSYAEQRHQCFPQVRGMNFDDMQREILGEKKDIAFHAEKLSTYLRICNITEI